MTGRQFLTLLVLAVWIALGPVAMAFGGCVLMGAMCEGLCGTFSAAPLAPAPAMGPGPNAYLDAQRQDRLPDTALATAEPPPKLFALAS